MIPRSTKSTSQPEQYILTVGITQNKIHGFLVGMAEGSKRILVQRSVESNPGDSLSDSINKLVGQMPQNFENTVLVVDPLLYHSLPVHLAIKDKTKINQILPGILQDVCPYEIDGFVTASSISPNGSADKSHVHVAIADKNSIKATLEACRASDLDPIAIVSHTGASTALSTLDDGYEIIIIWDGEELIASLIKNHILVTEKIANCKSPDAALTQFIGTLTENFTSTINKVSWYGNEPSENVKNLLGSNEVSYYPLPDDTSAREFLAREAALFGYDNNKLPLSANFRVGEFRLKPRISVVIQEIVRLKSWIFSFIAILIVSALAYVAFLKAASYSLEQSIINMTSAVLPNSEFSDSTSALSALKNETATLDKQLQGLGNIGKDSPVEILALLSRDIPTTVGVQINTLEIKEAGIVIEGIAPDYQAIEKLKKEFDKKRLSYCGVKLSNVIDVGARKQFRFDLAPCGN